MSSRRVSLAAALLGAASFAAAADQALIEDFSQYPYLWKSSHRVSLDNPELAPGDPLALPGQVGPERVSSVTGPIHVAVDLAAHACRSRSGVVKAALLSTPDFDALDADPRSITLGGAHAFRYEHRGRGPRPRPRDADHDGDVDLLLFFHGHEACAAADDDSPAFWGRTYDGRWFTAGGSRARITRPFAVSTDWSFSDGLRFWYYGRDSGDTLRLELRDNRAPDPGPSGWRLVWRDEFEGPAGRRVDASRWSSETGDGTAQGIPGWGNAEREYYTDRAENAALDGQGNLVIRALKSDGSLQCYYGPCEYTSARLKTQDKVEIGHGRVEARIKLPAGAGLWPAFWALGSDIGQVGWPQCGEIDIMEYVGRRPNEVFGSLHGPGYSGANGVSGLHQAGVSLADAFHVFAIEWQRDRIEWFIDGVKYHSVTPADLAGKQWVFNKPFFMILNLAIGGYLGGEVDPGLAFPQAMSVDYVRVYAAPDTAERFEAGFTDDFSGWQELAVPFTSFARGPRQPEGAPDDGLTLSEVWGYGFRLPPQGLRSTPLYLDKVRLIQPAAAVVRNALDAGPGSLRAAVAAVASGGTITFDSALAGATVTLSSGPIWVSAKSVTIDASAAPGLTISGAGGDRLLIVDAGAAAVLRGLTLASGFAWDLAGGILANGPVELERVVVRDCTVVAGGGDWWKGGGGIYVGGGATLKLKDSTVSGNRTQFVSGGSGSLDGGGIYVFQGATLQVEGSTISGNVAANVGGGLRMLGSGSILNSTFSGNSTIGWYGSAIFHTDGVLSLLNSTVTGNVAPPSAPAAVFVGTFTPASATLSIANTVVAQNQDFGCFVAPWGDGAVILGSGGHNLFSDDTCNPAASDLIVPGADLGPLADNGGPTATHAPLPGSLLIDAADPALCPAADQRGVARPQGAACDIGSVELAP